METLSPTEKLKQFDSLRIDQFFSDISKHVSYHVPIKSTKALVSLAANNQLTLGQGYETFKQLYDITETGLNVILSKSAHLTSIINDVNHTLTSLSNVQNLFPVETERSKEQIIYQQFSTPLTLAYFMCLAANIKHTDNLLEPSAGTGTIACIANAFKPQSIHVNELSKFRHNLLSTYFNFQCTNEDAIYLPHQEPFISNQYSVILMNPPFARSAHRNKTKADPMESARHISSALQLLKPKGRLIAIAGQGMSFDAARYLKWWKSVRNTFDVKANILLDDKMFKQKGTQFRTRMIVIDNQQPQNTTPITGLYDTVEQLIEMTNTLSNNRI